MATQCLRCGGNVPASLSFARVCWDCARALATEQMQAELDPERERRLDALVDQLPWKPVDAEE